LSSKQTCAQHSGTVYGEQGPDAVELRREDFEDDQGKRELAEGGANISTFERSLGRSNLDELVRAQDDGAGTMQAEMVSVCGVAALFSGVNRRLYV
jgi:hypothetical protein